MSGQLMFVVRRLLLTIPMLFVMSVVVFLILRLVPGDPVRTMLGFRATSLVLESMKGKLDGTSMRVPVPTGSITDFNAILSEEASVAEINAAFAKAAKTGPLKGIVKYTEDPIVSTDIQGDPHSCILDSELTMSMGKLVKVLGWYDNEWGYSNRMVDFMLFAGKKLSSRKKK